MFFHQFHSDPQILHNQKIAFAPHLHEETEILCLFDGEAVLVADGTEYLLESGDCVILFPYVIHSYTSAGAVDVGKFIFNSREIAELQVLTEEKIPISPRVSREDAEHAGILPLAHTVLKEYGQSTPAVRRAWLHLLSAKLLGVCPLCERNGTSGDLLQRILEFCRCHCREELTVQSVAEEFHVSRSYFSHLFGSRVSMNFCDYLNALRVNEAQRVLSETHLTVTQIASECGFGSVRSFNRAFLKSTQMSPRDWRKQCGCI